jgi:hypothetical protein
MILVYNSMKSFFQQNGLGMIFNLARKIDKRSGSMLIRC